MGRFETLNAQTKDLVNCLLPALASAFNTSDVLNIIPEDIRMRAWDCDKRDHIKDKTENDARNWGVQFLKDLMSIARMMDGDLAKFHEDLRDKVSLHEPKHPWCRLADIKEIKADLEHPERKNAVVVEPSSSEDSYDSYFEELVEPDEPRGAIIGRKHTHEVYEARVQQSNKRRKQGRLRRGDGGGFERVVTTKKKQPSVDRSVSRSEQYSKPKRRAFKTVDSDDDDDDSVPHERPKSLLARSASVFSATPGDTRSQVYTFEDDTSDEPLEVQKLQAELEVAEAELKAARLKYQYIQAKERAEKEASYGGIGTEDEPHMFN